MRIAFLNMRRNDISRPGSSDPRIMCERCVYVCVLQQCWIDMWIWYDPDITAYIIRDMRKVLRKPQIVVYGYSNDAPNKWVNTTLKLRMLCNFKTEFLSEYHATIVLSRVNLVTTDGFTTYPQCLQFSKLRLQTDLVVLSASRRMCIFTPGLEKYKVFTCILTTSWFWEEIFGRVV